MSAASNYLENALIDHLLRGQTLTAPATVYVGLSTTAPGEASFGTEVTGTGYARKAVTSSLANWAGTQGAGTTAASSGSSGLTSNNAAITFATPGAGGWGTVTHWFIADALTSGNLLFYGTLPVPKTVNQGDEVSFVAGALQITVA